MSGPPHSITPHPGYNWTDMIPVLLRQSLSTYAADPLSTDAFLSLWRTEAMPLCDRLPPAYRRALDDMLMRIESSRLFSGDSCSFSRESLCEALTMWLDKAEAKLSISAQR